MPRSNTTRGHGPLTRAVPVPRSQGANRAVPALVCENCGIRFAGSAYYTHQNAYLPYHPLHRCLDQMELQALGYKRRKSDGAYTADLTTDAHPSSARQLATFRSEAEHYELTGDVPVHVRMVPLGWVEDSLAKATPTAKQTEARRAKEAARSRRYRARKVVRSARLHIAA
jgi:hypothetical protein